MDDLVEALNKAYDAATVLQGKGDVDERVFARDVLHFLNQNGFDEN